MRIRTLVLPTIFLLLFLLSCKGCQKNEPATVLHLAPFSAASSLWIPNAADFGKNLEQFTERATKRAGGAMFRRVRDGLRAKLGFDILELSALEQHGILAKKGFVIFSEGSSMQLVAALAISDKNKFDAFLLKMMASLDGATEVSEEVVSDFTVKTLGRPFGDTSVPVLTWTHLRGHVLMSLGNEKDALKSAALRISKADYSTSAASLPQNPAYAALAKKVPTGDCITFLAGVSELKGVVGKDYSTLSEGVLTSLRARSTGLTMESFVSLKVPGLKDALAGKPVLELSNRIESDAVFMALTRVVRPDGMKAARNYQPFGDSIDRVVGMLSETTGLEIEKNVLPLFKGPMTIGVHLANLGELPKLLKQSDQGFARALGTLLNMIHIGITAEITDDAKLSALLESGKAKVAQRGSPIRTVKEKIANKDVIIFEPDTDNPGVGWAVVDGYYIYSAGQGRLRRTVEHVLTGKGTLQKELSAGVGGGLAAEAGASVFVLRSEQLAQAATEIMNALGAGKGALGLSLIVNQAVELIQTIGDLGIAISGEDDGIRIVFREQLK